MIEEEMIKIDWFTLEDFFDTHFDTLESKRLQRRFALACAKEVLPVIDELLPNYHKHWALYEIGKRHDKMSHVTYAKRINRLGKIADEINKLTGNLKFDRSSLPNHCAAWEAAWTVQNAVGLVGNSLYFVGPASAAAADSSMRVLSHLGRCPVQGASYFLPEQRKWQYNLIVDIINSNVIHYERSLSCSLMRHL